MALKDDIALLSGVPLFRDLNDEQLRLLAFGAERRRVAAGQTLFRQATPADCAYVVASGSFQLTRQDSRGASTKVGTATAGALLGELAMISAVPRKLTAVAAEASDVIRITRPLFQRMLEEYPDLALLMRERITANLAGLLGQIGGVEARLRR